MAQYHHTVQFDIFNSSNAPNPKPDKNLVLSEAKRRCPLKGTYGKNWTYEWTYITHSYTGRPYNWTITVVYSGIASSASASKKKQEKKSEKKSDKKPDKKDKRKGKSGGKSGGGGSSSKDEKKRKEEERKRKQQEKKWADYAAKAKKDPDFMVWCKYMYFNQSSLSDEDWRNGKTGEDISNEQLARYWQEYTKKLGKLANSRNKKKKAEKVEELLKEAKEKGSNKGHEVAEAKKLQDVKNDSEGTGDNNNIVRERGELVNGYNTLEELERSPQYYVWDGYGNVRRVLTDSELEEFMEIDPSTGKPKLSLKDRDLIVVQTGDGNYVIMSKDEVDDASARIGNIVAQLEHDVHELGPDSSAWKWDPDDIWNEEQAIEHNVTGFDVRMGRFDAMMLDTTGSSGKIVMPFASDTVASCFSDMVFTVDQDRYEKLKDAAKNKQANMNKLSNPDEVKKLHEKLTALNDSEKASQKTKDKQGQKTTISPPGNPGLDPNYTQMKTEGNLHGTASLMNPYAITRLYGALGDIKAIGDTGIIPSTNRMYDIRDQRRFYDLVVETDRDFLSVTMPTTTNIINWSNKDAWGRTPYGFTDFVFCKWWNIIPNNRLITLRKYAAPCLDNLNFEGMQQKKENDWGWTKNPNTEQANMFAPVATAVTYFGESTGNTLKDLLTISTGLPWGDLQAHIWTVSGDQGSNEMQTVDDQINQGLSGWSFLDNIAKDVQSFGKFVGLFEKGGFSAAKDDGVVDKHYQNMKDPYTDGPYTNRILGPVNKISKLKQRAKSDGGEAEDLKFEHSLSVTFNYVSRPIGGINTKAAMLDILANLLEIGSASAVFWGGGHRFEIQPHTYPWGGAPGQKGIMHKLYQGNIFGEDGALHDLMKGILSLGKDSKTGQWSWDNVTNQLKNVFQGITGAISQAINSIASSVGIAEDIVAKGMEKAENMIANATDDPEAAKKAQEKGKEKMNNLMNNAEEMLKSRMIKATTMPTVSGMRALLIGNPVGNWHLTIGNPLNPIAVIGNLVCSNMKFNFSEELGPDDFPMELECVFTLEHGMARDKDAISSMFNRGAGKIYNLPDKLRVTSDYETKVDAYTGSTQWRMGASYMSRGAMNPGYSGKGYNLGTTSSIPNSENATLFLPKFSPIIIPDSANWDAVKDSANKMAEGWNRSVFKANLATRKQLI